MKIDELDWHDVETFVHTIKRMATTSSNRHAWIRVYEWHCGDYDIATISRRWFPLNKTSANALLERLLSEVSDAA